MPQRGHLVHDHLRRGGRTAAITASRSSPSTTTGSAPASRNRATLPGVLVVAVTS